MARFSIRARAKKDPLHVAALMREVLASPARHSLGEAVHTISLADVPSAHEQQLRGAATGKTVVSLN